MIDEHFTVAGTLIQAWASQKSFRAKDGSDDGDGTNFRGQKRSSPRRPHNVSDPDVNNRIEETPQLDESYFNKLLVAKRIAAATSFHLTGGHRLRVRFRTG